MIGNVIQFQFFTANNYPTAAALGFILVVGVMALVTIYTRAVGAEKLTQG
jgi:spermidine/putrescine transport system permease protein